MSERKSLQKIPKFESEDEEREFWATRDSTAHVDWNRARAATFPNLTGNDRTKWASTGT